MGAASWAGKGVPYSINTTTEKLVRHNGIEGVGSLASSYRCGVGCLVELVNLRVYYGRRRHICLYFSPPSVAFILTGGIGYTNYVISHPPLQPNAWNLHSLHRLSHLVGSACYRRRLCTFTDFPNGCQGVSTVANPKDVQKTSRLSE